jgi:hypothetical protein
LATFFDHQSPDGRLSIRHRASTDIRQIPGDFEAWTTGMSMNATYPSPYELPVCNAAPRGREAKASDAGVTNSQMATTLSPILLVIPVSPGWSSEGPKHVVKTGKTPVLEAEEWRKLLNRIPTLPLRDLLFSLWLRSQANFESKYGT